MSLNARLGSTEFFSVSENSWTVNLSVVKRPSMPISKELSVWNCARMKGMGIIEPEMLHIFLKYDLLLRYIERLVCHCTQCLGCFKRCLAEVIIYLCLIWVHMLLLLAGNILLNHFLSQQRSLQLIGLLYRLIVITFLHSWRLLDWFLRIFLGF